MCELLLYNILQQVHVNYINKTSVQFPSIVFIVHVNSIGIENNL